MRDRFDRKRQRPAFSTEIPQTKQRKSSESDGRRTEEHSVERARDQRAVPRRDEQSDLRRERHSQKETRKLNVSAIDPEDTDAIAKAFGFQEFGSTKGKHVFANRDGTVDIKKKVQYRQILHKKKLYEVPLTRQQLEEKQRLQAEQTQS